MSTHTEVSLRFGEWLLSQEAISSEALSAALAEQKQSGNRLGVVLRQMQILSEEQITSLLAEYLCIESMSLDDISKINLNVARLLPENIAKRFCLVAIQEEADRVVIAIADPLNIVALDIVSGKLKRDVKAVLSSQREILQAIELIYHGSDVQEQRLRDLVQMETDQEEAESEFESEFSVADDMEVEEGATKAPVIRFVDLLMSQAIKSRASDIHIEPQENSMIIRMRVDGMLREMVPPARKMQAAIIARIKIISRMDIAERRLPQDGRFKINAGGHDVDVRVSIIPVIYGEKLVMRILDTSSVNHDLDSLGLEDRFMKTLKTSLALPHGIIVVTGPTGSGKSTTLYSALNYLKDPCKNITTVEDPVEYRLEGINQIQVKPEIELDFAKCLRSILRQDPDIILLGEIRDKETMEIAMKASLTGHLVLSTFHTNDAPSTLSRLMYMGLERYLLASTLNLVVAQRLVRKNCDRCKVAEPLSKEMLKQLRMVSDKDNPAVYYRGQGCPDCSGVGYFGRLPIFEFLPIDNEISEKVVNGATEAQIRTLARQKGYDSLMSSGINKMKQGLTTPEEILRITFSEEVSL